MESGSWMLHDDNATYSLLSVKEFLTMHNILLVLHVPYPTDLAPADFLFPKRNILGSIR
jgi:hypothetical protein